MRVQGERIVARLFSIYKFARDFYPQIYANVHECALIFTDIRGCTRMAIDNHKIPRMALKII